MKPSEIMWSFFMVTGNVDAYLLYVDCVGEEADHHSCPRGGVLKDLL